MSHSAVRLLLFLACTFLASAQSHSRDLESAGKAWWKHIEYLADDSLEGRQTGSPGYLKAADYVAGKFKEYGLEPAWKTGYFQSVPFEVQRIVSEKSSISLVRDGQRKTLNIGPDLLLSASLPAPKRVKAPLFFLGYGLHIPEAGFDDFAGQDVKGKIVVYINGGPADISGPLKSNARSAQEFYKALENAGAVGIIRLFNPKDMEIPWSRMSQSPGRPGMWIADAAAQDTKKPLFLSYFNPDQAEQLFAGSGHSLKELLALADAGKPLPRFPLKGELEASLVTERSRLQSPNVAAILSGSDPKLKNEYVTLSAHLDHVGVGRPINGDAIYNGAMDNASGIASILEIARALKASKTPLKRSVLFVAVTAEEKGLLGSRYFVAHPPVPKTAMVADVNMDMFLPIIPLKLLTVQGLEESSLGEDLEQVAKAAGIRVQRDQQPDRNLFIRSDQYNFIRAGVPALAFKFSGEPGSPEEKAAQQWLTERYHGPADDLSQPVDLEGAARFDELLAGLVTKIANSEARPRWHDSSFFKRFAGGN